MTDFGKNWDDNWSNTSINGSTITNSSSATTAEISSDGKTDTEVGVEVVYGNPANEGVMVYVLREIFGNYQAVADKPWGFEMPYSTSGTLRVGFTVPAEWGSKWKVHLANAAGASVTATVKTKQAVITSA